MRLALLALLTAMVCTVPHAGNPARDGSHDFDWETGSWDTRLQRLRTPLGGKSEWLDYAGSTLVRPALRGRANLVELDVRGPAGRIAGVSLRLYHPDSGQWALHFANMANGEMSEPVHGGFVDGRGSFYGMDTLNGRRVLVRFLIIPHGPGQWRFEQAYSADGGASWEDNWIAIDTHRPGTAEPAR